MIYSHFWIFYLHSLKGCSWNVSSNPDFKCGVCYHYQNNPMYPNPNLEHFWLSFQLYYQCIRLIFYLLSYLLNTKANTQLVKPLIGQGFFYYFKSFFTNWGHFTIVSFNIGSFFHFFFYNILLPSSLIPTVSLLVIFISLGVLWYFEFNF